MPIDGDLVAAVKALANERRLAILAWLKTPTEQFPPQVDGDLERDGVCGVLIARKLGVSQPTASEHLAVLVRAGLSPSASSSGRSSNATSGASPP